MQVVKVALDRLISKKLWNIQEKPLKLNAKQPNLIGDPLDHY